MYEVRIQIQLYVLRIRLDPDSQRAGLNMEAHLTCVCIGPPLPQSSADPCPVNPWRRRLVTSSTWAPPQAAPRRPCASQTCSSASASPAARVPESPAAAALVATTPWPVAAVAVRLWLRPRVPCPRRAVVSGMIGTVLTYR